MNRSFLMKSSTGTIAGFTIFFVAVTCAMALCINVNCAAPNAKKYVDAAGKSPSVRLSSMASRQSAGSAASAFAFTGQASKEKTFFNFGVLLSDMEIIAARNNQSDMRFAMDYFVKVLTDFRAPPPLLSAARNLKDKMDKAGDPVAEFVKGFFSLSDDIEAFVLESMDANYVALGAWAELARIFLAIDNIAESFVRENDAASLLNDLAKANLPPSILKQLKTLESLGRKEQIGSRDISAAQKAVDTIFTFMT